jgi:bacillithiol biosynthesis cysteine-adding enzyme BshC
MTESGCIPFSELPESTQLFLDYVQDFERVRGFYPIAPRTAEIAGYKRPGYPAERRAHVAKVLERQNRSFGASQKTLDNIERLRNGANAIVTGQQVVLFGGPAFAIYKALTAVKLANELTRFGREHIPIFWLATQDHDFAEVQHITLRSNQGQYEEFSVTSTAPAGTQVGEIKLGADAKIQAARAADFLGKGTASELLQHCYGRGETLGSSLGKLFAALFADYGLVLIDPRDSELAEVAAPLYESAIEHAPELTQELVARGKVLEEAGYHQQVKVTQNATLLFVNENGIRTPVKLANGGFGIGNEKISAKHLSGRLCKGPGSFSGNALLRPVVQDFLLPTTAYVGGPSEVAYFAQASVVYEKLLSAATPIVPRFSVTLLDARDHRLLEEYRLPPVELLRHGNDLGEELSQRVLPADVSHRLGTAEREVKRSLAALRESIARLDSTLGDSAKHAESKMRYQLAKLRGRVARAQLRRSQELARHADILRSSVLPHGKLQEREIGGLSFIAQFGPDLLKRLYDALQAECFGHRFIQL